MPSRLNPNRRQRRGVGANRKGPNQRGAFSQSQNQNPNFYAGHTWRAPGDVTNGHFPALLTAQNQQVGAGQHPQQTGTVESAWTEHFSLQDIEPPLQDGASWVAPRLASLPVVHTGSASEQPKDTLVTENPLPETLDVLFSSEAIQRNRFAGLTTAEAQLFALQPVNVSGEAMEGVQIEGQEGAEDEDDWFQKAFGEKMLDTEPETWLGIFQKQRWVGAWKNVDSRDGDEQRVFWDWNNDRIEQAIKPSVVLADSIFCQAIQGRWLQTVLQKTVNIPQITQTLKDGSAQTTHTLTRRDSRTYIEAPEVSLVKHKRINSEFSAEDVDFGVDRIEKEWQTQEEMEPGFKPHWTERVDTSGWAADAEKQIDGIAPFVFWTFFDEESDPEREDGRELYHVRTIKRPDESGEKICIIALSTEMFLPMLDEDASPMEKVLAMHTAAIVILRGLISAIKIWKCDMHKIADLAMGNEKLADLVSSFENEIFGGKLNFPFHHDRVSSPRNGKALLITGEDWPNAGDWVRDYFPKSETWMERLRMLGTTDPQSIRTQWHSYPIPGAWSVNMFKADFWTKTFKEGLSLKFPKHFKAVTQRCAETWGGTHLESKTFPVQNPVSKSLRQWGKSAKPEMPIDLLEKECFDIGDRLRARRLLWEENRKDWGSDALLAWELTPYSMPQSRWMLTQLKGWIDEQSPHSEYLAHELLFRFWLNEKPSANGGPLGWFYVALGHMFASCLPARTEYVWNQPTHGVMPAKNYQRAWDTVRWLVSSLSYNPADVDVEFATDIVTPGFPSRIRHGGLDERKRRLRTARKMGEIYFSTRPHTKTLKKTFMTSLRNLEHQAKEETDPKNWWVCQFVLPPYSAELEGVNLDHAHNVDAVSRQPDVRVGESGVVIKPQAFHQFAATMIQAQEKPKDQIDNQTQAQKQAETLQKTQPVPMGPLNKDTMADENYLAIQGDDYVERYWTVGEIADKVAQGKQWVVEPTGDMYGRYMVVDIARAVAAEGFTPEQMSAMVERHRFGFEAKGGSLKHHFSPDSWKLFEKVGYVIQWVTETSVRAMDGAGENPLWIQIGTNVFDITNFPWHEFGGTDLAIRLRKQFQNLTTSFLEEGGDLYHHYHTVLERLMPYRCATTSLPASTGARESDLKMFLTREEVRWNEFPETGMYVVIDGNVYDVSDYHENHPGGEHLIRANGGRDISTDFHNSHTDSHALLEGPLFQAMLVGRIIPTRSYDQHCRDWEYERSNYIWSNRPQDTYPDGSSYCIAKKLKKAGPLVRMRPKELELCDGDDGEGWFNEAWCAVGDLIYNMTSVVRYSKEPWIAALKPFLGGRVTDESVMRHVWKYYRFRAVAILENEDTEDDYVFGKRQRGAPPRDYALRLQKRNRMLFNDPPADIYFDEEYIPHSNIPDVPLKFASPKYPFKTPKRRHPPAPYNDYSARFDKDTFLQHASGKYYKMLKDEAQRRKGEEISRRDQEGRRVGWAEFDIGQYMVKNQEATAGVEMITGVETPSEVEMTSRVETGWGALAKKHVKAWEEKHGSKEHGHKKI